MLWKPIYTVYKFIYRFLVEVAYLSNPYSILLIHGRRYRFLDFGPDSAPPGNIYGVLTQPNL